MANKMLIDAGHPEETRVVVVRGQKVEEFDFESASRRPLRGNIYLAKVTRVEPSLQAAFVEYGGNRHGFLAFAEIHPDYYQIPVADRQALLEEQARYADDDDEDQPRDKGGRGRRRRRGGKDGGKDGGGREKRAQGDATLSAPAEIGDGEMSVDADNADAELDADNGAAAEGSPAAQLEGAFDDRPDAASDDDDAEDDGEDGEAGVAEERPAPEQLGGGDALDDVPERPRYVSRRQYKIQEVIKRRQILLVQVVKEERGNKGAALTTYLSLAGRYSVLMPNTGRGGGISRKITSAEDRKRLKEIASELEVPDGMGIILRTAGASRTKPEIKRDYEYLMRLWESVRELTLNSTAPALVYEEGSLIKRAIRDLYNKDIDDILVAGDEGYREAKAFMKMLMPSHAKAIQPYREPQPLFARFGVESQLDAMFGSQVTLRSGGYIVINQTEALVSIDVNSGRSTREHNIEDTALKTNLEAAEEISRQLRLRDLAGLIVIDFIDMEEKRNNRAVEKRLKECLKNDRARIQVGHISAFGLLEMSRQRIRTGVLESSSIKCPHCEGTGFIRSTPSVALQILRGVEETLIKSATHNLIVKTRSEVALYVLNQKRGHLTDLEARFGVHVTVEVDNHLVGSNAFAVERGEFVHPDQRPVVASVRVDSIKTPLPDEDDDIDIADEAGDEDDAPEAVGSTERAAEAADDRGDGGRRRRRRRRRRRGREGGLEQGEGVNAADGEDDDGEEAPEGVNAEGAPVEIATAEVAPVGEAAEAASADDDEDDPSARRRRRGRRGGRRARADGQADDAAQASSETVLEEAVAVDAAPMIATEADAPAPADAASEAPAPEAKPKRATRSRKKKVEAEPAATEPVAVVDMAAVDGTEASAQPEAPAPAEPEAPVAPEASVAPEPEPVAIVLTPPDPERPKRGGWWSRK
jgi:ribonuclease E